MYKNLSIDNKSPTEEKGLSSRQKAAKRKLLVTIPYMNLHLVDINRLYLNSN